MNPNLDTAYQAVENTVAALTVELGGAAGVAAVDQIAAQARDGLASYGVDLADDATRDAVLATTDWLLASLRNGAPARTQLAPPLAHRLASLLQAIQRANAAAAPSGGT